MTVSGAVSDLARAALLLTLLFGCAAQTGAGSASAGSVSAGSVSASPSDGSTSLLSTTGTPAIVRPTPRVAACAQIYRGAEVANLSPADSLIQVRVCIEDPSTGEVFNKSLGAAESQETLDWLAGLLAEPSASRDESLICTAELRSVPDFVVTTQSGQLLAPIVPTDPCGKPSLEVVKLLEQIGSP